MNDATKFTILALAVVLLVFVSDSDAIKCVRCNSALVGHEKCADPWPKPGTPELEVKIKQLQEDINKANKGKKKFNVTCGEADSKVIGCWKLAQSSDVIKPDGYSVKRECAYTEGPKKCLERIGTGSDAKVKYCQCEGDFCNGSNNLKLSLSVIISSFCLFAVIRRLSA